MKTELYFKMGKIFFGVSILAIGVIHLAFGQFPVGFVPVEAGVPARSVLGYVDGILWIITGLFIISQRFARQGAMLASVIFIILLVTVHIPIVVQNLGADNIWAGAFEMVYFISGALLCLGITMQREDPSKYAKAVTLLLPIGRYLLAVSFFAFGFIHYKDERFIENLLLPWMPFKTFWCWLVVVAFFAAFISFTINKLVWLSSQLLALMYLLWVLTLHGPLVATHLHVEPQWTSFFVAFGTVGISLLAYCSVQPVQIAKKRAVITV